MSVVFHRWFGRRDSPAAHVAGVIRSLSRVRNRVAVALLLSCSVLPTWAGPTQTASAASAAPQAAAPAPVQAISTPTQPVSPGPTPDSPAAGDIRTAAVERDGFVIGPGDMLKLTVFQYPDLATETRVAADGTVGLPLVGEVAVAGMRPNDAERKIADLLRQGGFVKQAQVTLVVSNFRSQQVAVLGNVNRPGKFPLEMPYTVSDVLALAGGVAPTGADTVILSRTENGVVKNYQIDLPELFLSPESRSKDMPLVNGDVLYVHRYPLFYIYGEVQRPGSYRVERNMTVMQALSTGGGLTIRGTERGVRVDRRAADGSVQTLRPKMTDAVQPDDVVYIRESLF